MRQQRLLRERAQNTRRNRDKNRSRGVSLRAASSAVRFGRRQSRKRKDQARAAARIVRHGDAAAMRAHDFGDDGETEAGALLLFARAAPEPLEDVRAILWQNTAAAIRDFDAARVIDRH